MVPSNPVAMMQRETRVRYGNVPHALAATGVSRDQYALADDAFLMRTAEGLAFHYRKGDGVVVERSGTSDPRDEHLYLNGSVYAAVASINGLYPLHASAVAVGGRVVAFTGASGAGKSTLIAELGQRGFAMFCDDTLILDFSADGPVTALPGHKRLKLTTEALVLTGAGREEQVASMIDKFFAQPPAGTVSDILPLAELMLLEDGNPARIEPIVGGQRLHALQDDHYTQGLFLAANRPDRATRFAQLSRLARAIAVSRFVRPRDARRFAADVDLVEAHLYALAAKSAAPPQPGK